MEFQFLLTLSIILVSTKAFGILSGKLQMPQVVGALVAGLLFGPAVLNIIQPNEVLHVLAELGVVVIMFGAGLETSISDLKASGKNSFLIALLGVLVPLGAGIVLMNVFNGTENILESVFLGIILTATSVSITVATLKEMGKLSTKVGNTILAAALIDDVLGLVCLTIVTSMAGESANLVITLLMILLFFVFAAVVGIIFNKFFNWYVKRAASRDMHRYPIIALALCLFMAWSAEAIFGVADIIGAFAAGLIIASTPKRVYVESKINPLSYLMLTPIFFANIGLSVTLPQMSGSIIVFTILLIIVGFLTKLIGCGGISKACGFTNRQSLQIGLGMVCRGEVALIVANKGLSIGLLPEEFFGPIVIMVVFCAVVTPALLKMAFRGESEYEGLQESDLVDHYELSDQLDIVTEKLLNDEQNIAAGKK